VASSMDAPKWGQSWSQYTAGADHAGRAREVPQEDRSPSMYNDQYMCVLVKRYSTFFSQNMLSGIPTFKIYIFKYVHEIIANSRCPFLVHKLCSYNNRCLIFAG
jgi:hypothetical protein